MRERASTDSPPLELLPADSLLTEYLGARDGREEQRLLESLIVETRAIVSRVLAARFGRDPHGRDQAEDACQDCMVAILARIQRLKTEGDTPVRSLSAYAAATAQNAFRGNLRQARRSGHQVEDRTDMVDELDRLPDTTQAVEDSVIEQGHREDLLRKAWRGILKLPLPQRRALLLALPPDAFLAYRLLVGPAALGDCLNLSPSDIDTLPAHLPIADAELAEAMKMKRQKVINLRQAARQRLARWMGDEG